MREEQEWEAKGAVGAPGDVVKGDQTPRVHQDLVLLEIPKEVGKCGRERALGMSRGNCNYRWRLMR